MKPLEFFTAFEKAAGWEAEIRESGLRIVNLEDCALEYFSPDGVQAVIRAPVHDVPKERELKLSMAEKLCRLNASLVRTSSGGVVIEEGRFCLQKVLKPYDLEHEDPVAVVESFLNDYDFVLAELETEQPSDLFNGMPWV